MYAHWKFRHLYVQSLAHISHPCQTEPGPPLPHKKPLSSPHLFGCPPPVNISRKTSDFSPTFLHYKCAPLVFSPRVFLEKGDTFYINQRRNRMPKGARKVSLVKSVLRWNYRKWNNKRVWTKIVKILNYIFLPRVWIVFWLYLLGMKYRFEIQILFSKRWSVFSIYFTW